MMFTLILIAAIFLVLVFTELKPMYRNEKKTFWVYACVGAAAFFLWILVALNVRVPGLSEPIKNAIAALLGVR